MSANEVLIRHGGYTDTAYSTCGYKHCNDAVLLAVGVSAADLELYGDDLNDHPVGDDTYVTVVSLGETDSDEFCAGCGDFLRHGLECECENPEEDRENLNRPHIDLESHEAIKALHE